MILLIRSRADQALIATKALLAPIPRDTDPLLLHGAGSAVATHEDDFPFARGEEVADHEVVLVPVERVLGFVHEDLGVGFEFEGYDHCFGGPAVDSVVGLVWCFVLGGWSEEC